MFVVTRSDRRIEFREQLAPATRLFFAAAAAVPLLAPYELLVRPAWKHTAITSAFIPLTVSAGAILVSLLLVMAALASLNHVVNVDATRRVVTSTTWSPVRRRLDADYMFDEFAHVGLHHDDWSEGPPTWRIEFGIEGERPLRCGRFDSREQALLYLELIGNISGIATRA